MILIGFAMMHAAAWWLAWYSLFTPPQEPSK